jgi:colanic acid/amylovoran biosynthesis protein
MNKKILIYAYTALNLGDDLFVKILCNRYPESKFYIFCTKNVATPFKNIDNLTIIPLIPRIDGIFKKLHLSISVNNFLQRIFSLFCDAIVHVGGSIFMQRDNWKNKANDYKKRVFSSKRYFVLGSNFGPYKDIDYFLYYKEIFKSVTDVCFREKYSYNLFSDLTNVRYESDIVFSFPVPNIDERKKQLVISVIDLSWRENLKAYECDYLEKIAELSTYLTKNDYIVYLMGFCNSEGDNKAINRILTLINDDDRKNVKTNYYYGNLDYAISLIQQSQFVVATRFHAMILGWVFKKPVYPIIYSDKSLHVIEDVKFDGLHAKIENMKEVEVSKVLEYLLRGNTLNIETHIYSAENQFKKLDELLLDNR